MSKRLRVLICVSLLASGCRTAPMPSIDAYLADVVGRPIDVAPAPAVRASYARPGVGSAAPVAAPKPRDAGPAIDAAPPPVAAPKPRDAGPAIDAAPPPVAATPIEGVSAALATQPDSVVRTSITQVDRQRPAQKKGRSDEKIIRASFTQPERTGPGLNQQPRGKFDLTIPKAVPGSEAPLLSVPDDPEKKPAAAAELFPPLPPLADEPVAQPGPDGRPYTLADFQRLAAENNPGLRQAAAGVEAAKGLMIQAGLYPNPNVGYETSPNANNTASTTIGAFIDQTIKTGGKLTLAVAGARMGMVMAALALKQTRYALATTIRGDFYTLLVAQETVRVNRGLAHFTDEIFRLQADLLAGSLAAAHEPAALRSQAFVVRLAYKNSIANYIYAWKQLVADMGLRQLPLSAVSGQVDRMIPYYDYDEVLAYVLHNHTNIHTARANLDQARYNLKLAQVTPVPDIDVRADLWKEHQVLPLQNYMSFQVGIPFPIWNRNQGNILNASAAMAQASEGPHAAEVALTTNLAAAYANYKNSLFAMDYYRRNILPDQVRYYRGVVDRRQVDPQAAFGDLVQAQQTLVADVTAYLGILGSLWNSVVGVADFLQTDDLYQLGKPLALPELPDLNTLHVWPCSHPNAGAEQAPVQIAPTPAPHAGAPTARAPTVAKAPAQPSGTPAEKSVSIALTRVTNPGQPARDPDQKVPVRQPTLFAPSFMNPSQKRFDKLLGLDDQSVAGSTSAADPPPDLQAVGPFTPAPSQRSSATSLVGGAK
jgi:outer membrane protein, heavy metal efflux system